MTLKTLYSKSETGCCPRFDPKSWEKKKVVFKNKLFVKDRVLTLFRIPLNMGKVMVRNVEKIAEAKALPPKPLMLYDCHFIGMSVMYIAVSKNVPNSEMVKISGTFLT